MSDYSAIYSQILMKHGAQWGILGNSLFRLSISVCGPTRVFMQDGKLYAITADNFIMPINNVKNIHICGQPTPVDKASNYIHCGADLIQVSGLGTCMRDGVHIIIVPGYHIKQIKSGSVAEFILSYGPNELHALLFNNLAGYIMVTLEGEIIPIHVVKSRGLNGCVFKSSSLEISFKNERYSVLLNDTREVLYINKDYDPEKRTISGVHIKCITKRTQVGEYVIIPFNADRVDEPTLFNYRDENRNVLIPLQEDCRNFSGHIIKHNNQYALFNSAKKIIPLYSYPISHNSFINYPLIYSAGGYEIIAPHHTDNYIMVLESYKFRLFRSSKYGLNPSNDAETKRRYFWIYDIEQDKMAHGYLFTDENGDCHLFNEYEGRILTKQIPKINAVGRVCDPRAPYSKFYAENNTVIAIYNNGTFGDAYCCSLIEDKPNGLVCANEQEITYEQTAGLADELADELAEGLADELAEGLAEGLESSASSSLID